MDTTTTAETVAAIWFTVIFGACLLALLWRVACKAARLLMDKREERRQ
jgi:hypothetical protein